MTIAIRLEADLAHFHCNWMLSLPELSTHRGCATIDGFHHPCYFGIVVIEQRCNLD
jgi:hypothetical protein